jgi:hypothetical protein
VHEKGRHRYERSAVVNDITGYHCKKAFGHDQQLPRDLFFGHSTSNICDFGLFEPIYDVSTGRTSSVSILERGQLILRSVNIRGRKNREFNGKARDIMRLKPLRIMYRKRHGVRQQS